MLPLFDISGKLSFTPINSIDYKSGLRIKNLSSLRSYDFKTIVKCPDGVDLPDWFKFTLNYLFKEIALLYNVITDYCTSETCPDMSAGPLYRYYWHENINGSLESLPADKYIKNLLEWFEIDQKVKLMNDKDGHSTNVSKLLTRLFRTYAHIYYHHYRLYEDLGLDTELNKCFKHLISFNDVYDLIPKSELEPLNEVIIQLM